MRNEYTGRKQFIRVSVNNGINTDLLFAADALRLKLFNIYVLRKTQWLKRGILRIRPQDYKGVRTSVI